MASTMKNHPLIDEGGPQKGGLGDIKAPTLVIHGTEDPLFPPGHGEVLAEEIPGAQLLLLERVGHELPPSAVWDVVIPAILRHTSACA